MLLSYYAAICEERTAAGSTKKPRPSSIDAKVKQTTAAKPAQLNSKVFDEVAINSGKDLQEDVDASPFVPLETSAFAIHFKAVQKGLCVQSGRDSSGSQGC